MDSLRTGLPIQKFPKTIQDAIHVTRKLGFQWLWVDSLCIIQDSIDDWTREAASLVDVYQNCVPSIAGLGATAAKHGLFSKRDPLIYKPCWLFRGSNGKDVFAHPHQSPETSPPEKTPLFDVCFNESVLHKRGWVIQERLLAPRTLNFGSSLNLGVSGEIFRPI